MRFEGLRETLLRGGVAPRHVRRYLAELCEHLDDLANEQRAAGYDDEDAAVRARARLGSDQELAGAILARMEFRSWTSRAPWAVFGLLPAATALALSFLPIGCLVLISKHFGFMGGHGIQGPEWFRVLAILTVKSVNLLVMPLTVLLFAATAYRQRITPVWPLISIAVLMILVVHSEVRFATGHSHGALSLGLGAIFLAPTWRLIIKTWPLVAAQYVLALLPILWLYRPHKPAG